MTSDSFSALLSSLVAWRTRLDAGEHVRLGRDEYQRLLGAYVLHTRGFADLAALHAEVLDGLKASEADVKDLEALLGVATWALGQLQGTSDESRLGWVPGDPAAVVITKCAGLRAALPESHPLVEVLARYEAGLATFEAAMTHADALLARVGDQHADLLVPHMLAMRPPLPRHRRVLATLTGFVGDPGIVAVYRQMEEVYRGMRSRVRTGEAEDECDDMLRDIARWILAVDLAPRSRALAILKQGPPSLATARESLRIDPTCPEAWLLLVRTNGGSSPETRLDDATAALAHVRGAAAASVYGSRGDALLALGRADEAAVAYMTQLDLLGDRRLEGYAAHATAGALLAAGRPAESLEFARIGATLSAKDKPATEEDILWALTSRSASVRIAGLTAKHGTTHPGVARALVALLTREVTEVWRPFFHESVAYTIFMAKPREVVLEALATVEIPDANIENWAACAKKIGDPALRTRAEALLARQNGRMLVQYLSAVGTDQPTLLATAALTFGDLDALERASAADPAKIAVGSAKLDDLAGAAAKKGHVGAVRLLVAIGADPQRALLSATTEVATALLADGADPDAGRDGETPLRLAARTGRAGVCRALVAAGATLDPGALTDAVTANQRATAWFLIQQGLTPDLAAIETQCPDLHFRLTGTEPEISDLVATRRWCRCGEPSAVLGRALMLRVAEPLAYGEESAIKGMLGDWALSDPTGFVAFAVALARGGPIGKNERPGFDAVRHMMGPGRDAVAPVRPHLPVIIELIRELWDGEQNTAVWSWLLVVLKAQGDHAEAVEYAMRLAEERDKSFPSGFAPGPGDVPRLQALLARRITALTEEDFAPAASLTTRLHRVEEVVELLKKLGAPVDLADDVRARMTT